MTNNAIGLHCVSSKGNIPKCQSHIQRGLHGTVRATEKRTTHSAATPVTPIHSVDLSGLTPDFCAFPGQIN